MYCKDDNSLPRERHQSASHLVAFEKDFNVSHFVALKCRPDLVNGHTVQATAREQYWISIGVVRIGRRDTRSQFPEEVGCGENKTRGC